MAPPRPRILALAVTCLFLTASCGDDTKDGDGDSGPFTITATLDPTPPQVGQHTMHIAVRDAEGQPVEGATLAVDPQMPMHGHGSTETPVVTEVGGGQYDAFPVTLTMPGMWVVTVQVQAAGDHGTKKFEYRVE